MNAPVTTTRTSDIAADIPHQVVRASAGAGKTYALSTRYLSLLANGAGPGSILATTFTRKAAGEILERVLQRLSTAAIDPACAADLAGDLGIKTMTLERCGTMLGKLIESLDRLAIGTIDSFLYRLVCSVRIEMGLPRRVELIGPDDPLAAQLRHRATEAVIGDDDIDTVIDLLRRAGQADAQRGVAQLIDRLVRGDLYDTYRCYPVEALWGGVELECAPLELAELTQHITRLEAAAGAHAQHKLGQCTPQVDRSGVPARLVFFYQGRDRQ